MTPPPKPNLVDRFADWVSPRWAYERRAYREARANWDDFESASTDDHLADWHSRLASADAHLAHGRRRTLIARSRAVERNTSIGRAIRNAYTRNVVGSGIRPRPNLNTDALGITSDQAEEFAEVVMARWPGFVGEAVADERGDFYEQQELVEARSMFDGDATTRIVRVDRPGRMYSTAAEVIEADLICTPSRESNNPRVREGVVRGRSSQAVAYYVANQYPQDYTFGDTAELKFRRLPVWDGRGMRITSMMARRTRASQTRGEPELAPVLERIRHFDRYGKAELVAKRIESSITGVIETAVAPGGGIRGAIRQNQVGGAKRLPMAPGSFPQLAPGQTLKIHDPKRPGSTFEPYTLLTIREIGAALDLPLELLFLDWSKSNYSNARAAILDARRGFQKRQRKLVREHSQPIYAAWIEELFLRGMLPAWVTDFYGNVQLWTAARWIPDGFRWVDPSKEGANAEIQLDRGMTSVPREIENLGHDWQQTTREQIRFELWKKKERAEMAREMGVDDAPEQAPPAPPNRNPRAEAEDAEEPADPNADAATEPESDE